MMKLRFYKTDQEQWFIDLPAYIEQGGHISHLQMVAGADNLLDFLSDGDREICLEVTTNIAEISFLDQGWDRILQVSDPVNLGLGCTYMTSMLSPHYEKMNRTENKGMLWLCPATLFVFGYYPQSIWFKRITKEKYEEASTTAEAQN